MLWNRLKKPIIALAPMFGVTDAVFRKIAKRYGADLVFSEMLVADSLVYAIKHKNLALKKKLFQRLEFSNEERPIVFQIAGNEPEILKEATSILIENFQPDGIDLNFACPAKSAQRGFYGGFLLKEPQRIIEIVRTLRKTFSLPLSLKIRVGVEEEKEIFQLLKSLEEAGLDALSVHGRTLKQGHEGEANWQIIYQCAERLKIPVLGSGGMLNAQSVCKFLENKKVAGVLIARGAIGHPQIFREVKALLENKPLPKISPIKVLEEHAQLAWQLKERVGLIELRKHLKGYLLGIPNGKKIRLQLMKCERLPEFLEILNREIIFSKF